uniref:Peptidase S74 domain-containing protein n=1 Tax=Geladintestivirus 3 TaxID=3233135 RepID=A0AAU8MH84_9CAUD
MSNIPTINEIDNNSPSKEIKDVVISTKVNQPSYVEVQETLSANAAIDEVDNTRKPTISEIYKIVTDGLFESTINWWDYAYKVSQAQINQDIIDRLDKGEIGGGYSKGVDIITTTSSKIPTNSNVYSALKSDSLYPKKLLDEEINGIYDFLNGITIGKPTSYTGGTWSLDNNGRTHLTTDYLYVRLKAIFEQLQILDVDTIGGKLVVSPAGSIRVAYVDEITDDFPNFVHNEDDNVWTIADKPLNQKVYRCYFLGEQNGESVDNKWKVGFQAQAKSFNIKKGTYHKTGNHYLWRLVVGVSKDTVTIDGKKYHYIDLSQLDYDGLSDAPAPGDILNHVGYRLNDEPSYQAALIFSAVDGNAPSITLYSGINYYSLVDKEYVEFGVINGHAFFNLYGDVYIGDRKDTANSYIRYNASAKTLDIKARISASSTVGNKTLNDYIRDNAPTLSEDEVKQIVNPLISGVKSDLQNQIDGAIETWFYEGVPTPNNNTKDDGPDSKYDVLTYNIPASDWYHDDVDIRETHIGDLYYDQNKGYAYRFTKYNDEVKPYRWNRIKDNDIVNALEAAKNAQSTADGKMTVFYGDDISKIINYKTGDIWVNATYPKSASKLTYNNEILRAQKDYKDAFDINDWVLASRYSDELLNLINFQTEYTKKFGELSDRIKAQEDSQIDTWFYERSPINEDGSMFKPWDVDDKDSEHNEDLFYDIANNRTYKFNGTDWIIIVDANLDEVMKIASKAQDTADAKRRIFYAIPKAPYEVGDLWIKSVTEKDKYNNDIKVNKTYVAIKENKNTSDYIESDWEIADEGLSNFTDIINNKFSGLEGLVTAIQGQVDGKADVWYRDTDPRDEPTWGNDSDHIGDIWNNPKGVKNNDGSLEYTFSWNGEAWEPMQVPDEIFDKIDGKSSIFVDNPDELTTTSPIKLGYEERDLWILPVDYSIKYSIDKTEKFYKGDILTAIHGMNKTKGFQPTDWEKKTSYMTSTQVETLYNKTVEAIGGVSNKYDELNTKVTNFNKEYKNFVADGVLTISEKKTLLLSIDDIEAEYNKFVGLVDTLIKSPFLHERNNGRLDNTTAENAEAKELRDTLNTFKEKKEKFVTNIKTVCADDTGSTKLTQQQRTELNNNRTNYNDAFKAIQTKIATIENYINSSIYNQVGTEYGYIRDALIEGKTEIDGGLVLTSLIQLRNVDEDRTVTAGINGVIDNTKKLATPAAWFGSSKTSASYNIDRIDLESDPTKWFEIDNARDDTKEHIAGRDYARSLFRHDGTGYLAGGGIWWTNDGILHANPNSFLVQGINWTDQKASALLSKLFYLHYDEGTDVNNIDYMSPLKVVGRIDIASRGTNIQHGELSAISGLFIGDSELGGAFQVGNVIIRTNSSDPNILEIVSATDGKVAHLGVSGGISAYGTYIPSTGGGGLNGSVIPYARILEGNYTDADLSSIPNAYSIKALYSKIENIDVSGQLVKYLTKTDAATLYQPVGSYASASHNHDSIYSKLGHTHSQYLTSTSLDGYATEQWVANQKYLTEHQSLTDYYTISSVDELLSAKADASDIPTKVSQLTNDEGYLSAITKAQVEDVLTGDITTHTHSKYLTTHQSLKGYATEDWVNNKGYTTNTGTVTSVKITLPTGLSLGATKEITTSGTFAISFANGYSIPTTAKQTAWDGAVTAKHSHGNKSVIDDITSTKVSHWDTAYTNNHTHANKGTLDDIDDDDVSHWDSAYDWYTLMTTDEATPDKVINKWNEVVNFLAGIDQADTLDGIVSGINTAISDETTRAKEAEQANATNISTNATNISTNKTNISTLQGYFSNGSAKKALQLTNSRKLWGNSFNGTADINGSIVVPDGKYISIGNIKLEYDKDNKALKVTNTTTNEVANLYASGGISAYGVSDVPSGGGGGLNGNVKSYADAIKLSSESLSEIASAYSIRMLSDRIGTLEDAGYISSVSWADIASKPSTFTPSAHTHNYASIVKVGQTEYKISGNTISIPAYPTSLPASDVYTWAKASAKPSYTWSEIGSKPSSYTPAAHTHTWEQITNRITKVSQLANDSGYQNAANRHERITVDANDIDAPFKTYESYGGKNMPNDSPWHQIFALGTGDINYRFQFANDYISNNHLYFRYKCAGTWYDWKTVIDDSNIGDQSVKYATSAGNADTLDGYHASALFTKHTREGAYNIDELTTFGTRDLQPSSEVNITGTKPFDGWGTIAVIRTDNSNNQLCFGDDNAVYVRCAYGTVNNVNNKEWKKIATTDGSVNYATSAGSANSVAWANVSGKPTKVSQFTNDSNFVTGSVSGNTITINGVSTTWQNTWRGITDSYSGTDSATSLSQKGGNALYNTLVNGYASSAGNADTVDGYHATSGRTFSGNINWSENWNDSWSDGRHSHPWYGFDHRYPNTGAYSSTLTDYWGITIKTDHIMRLDFGTLLLNGTSIYDINVATATKLQNTRTLWGQSFDGSVDVNGEFSASFNKDATLRIYGSPGGANERVYFQSGIDERLDDYDIPSYGGEERHCIILQPRGGRVGIGESNPSYKLDVSGNCRISTRLLINSTDTSRTLSVGGDANIATDLYVGRHIDLPSFGNSYIESGGADNDGSSYNTCNLVIRSWWSIGLRSYDGKIRTYFDTRTGNIGTRGNIVSEGGITAYSSSDIRLKHDLHKLDYLSIIRSMGGTFGFTWNKDNNKSIGWIAQNVMSNPYMSDLVEHDDDGYLKINYWSPKLIATAFGAIEQVDDEVERLKARVTFLESEVERLTGESMKLEVRERKLLN